MDSFWVNRRNIESKIKEVKLRKSKAKAKANAFTVALQFRHIDNLHILLSGILYHDFFSPIPILAVPFPAMEHVPIFSFTWALEILIFLQIFESNVILTVLSLLLDMTIVSLAEYLSLKYLHLATIYPL